MAINYDEVIAELRETESKLEEELEQVREAIPAMVVMRNRARAERDAAERKIPQATIPGIGKFSGMGATKAIPELLRSAPHALTTREIYDGLRAQGWTSSAAKPLGAISATLAQLEDNDIVVRVGDGWKLKPAKVSLSPSSFSNDPEQPSAQ
jgi:hypothetical protein